jgi:hypothetical protein
VAKKTTIEQIEIALDGRSQRWLALEIKMPETDLSKRMNNKTSFQQEEIDRINTRLKSTVQLIGVLA